MKKKTLGDKIRNCFEKAFEKNFDSFFFISDAEVGKTELSSFQKRKNGGVQLTLSFQKAKYKLTSPELENVFSPDGMGLFIDKAEGAKRKILLDDEKLGQLGFRKVRSFFYDYRIELLVPFFKETMAINITRGWNQDLAFSRWELGDRLMGSGYTGKDAFSLLNETFNKIREQMNEEVYLGLPENLRDYLICGEEENIWNWTAA